MTGIGTEATYYYYRGLAKSIAKRTGGSYSDVVFKNGKFKLKEGTQSVDTLPEEQKNKIQDLKTQISTQKDEYNKLLADLSAAKKQLSQIKNLSVAEKEKIQSQIDQMNIELQSNSGKENDLDEKINRQTQDLK